MISRIQEKLQDCKAVFDKINGGHSLASIESDFYKDLNSYNLFLALDVPGEIPMFFSKIGWIDFYDMYKEFNGTRKKTGISELLHEVRKNFQGAWSFSKMYNSDRSTNFVHLEVQINLAIDEIEEIISDSLDVYQCSEIFHFDTGGYDYSLIAIEFVDGVQVIEFLRYID